MTYSCITFSDLTNGTNFIAYNYNYFSCHYPFKGEFIGVCALARFLIFFNRKQTIA